MITLHPIKLTGSWQEGFALDMHSISSTFLGYDEYGHQVFDTQRSPIGELLYQLKYKADKTALKEIVAVASNFLVTDWKISVDAIVPVPPSKTDRPFQPVVVIAKGISTSLQISYLDALVKTKGTPELKNIFDYQRRSELLKDAFVIRGPEVKGKNILLFDDLFRSGATLNAITQVLYDIGKVKRVYVLSLTKTRSLS
jgi:predicted amidophosphoribosyltransferase